MKSIRVSILPSHSPRISRRSWSCRSRSGRTAAVGATPAVYIHFIRRGGGVANCIVVRSTELSASAGVGGWLGGEELQPCGDEMLMKVSLWQNPAGSVAFLMLIQFVASIFCYTPPTPTLPQPPQGNLRYKTLQTYTITHTIPRISDIGGYHGGKGKGKGSLNRLWRPRAGIEVKLYSFFNLGVSCWWVVSPTPWLFYPREKRPDTPCAGGLRLQRN